MNQFQQSKSRGHIFFVPKGIMATVSARPKLPIRQKKTTFMDLPPEIRTDIYGLSGLLRRISTACYCWCERCRDGVKNPHGFIMGKPVSSGSRAVLVNSSPNNGDEVISLSSNDRMKNARLTALDRLNWRKKTDHGYRWSSVSGNKPADWVLRDENACLYSTIVFLWDDVDDDYLASLPGHDGCLATVQPALTMVSHRVREETLAMFYGGQTFYYAIFEAENDSQHLLRWLKALGKSALFLRNLVLLYRKTKLFKKAKKTMLPCLLSEGVHVRPEVVKLQLLKYPHKVRLCCQSGGRVDATTVAREWTCWGG